MRLDLDVIPICQTRVEQRFYQPAILCCWLTEFSSCCTLSSLAFKASASCISSLAVALAASMAKTSVKAVTSLLLMVAQLNGAHARPMMVKMHKSAATGSRKVSGSCTEIDRSQLELNWTQVCSKLRVSSDTSPVSGNRNVVSLVVSSIRMPSTVTTWHSGSREYSALYTPN